MKILFAGLGSIGQRHLRNLRTLLGNKCEFLAYRTQGSNLVLNDEIEIDAGLDLASHYNIRQFYDLQSALAENPDIVFITNPTRYHVSVALEAARKGCNIFIEKPLSDNESQIQELVNIVEEKDLVATVGFQLRFHPCLRTIKKWLEENRIGHLSSARLETGEYLPGWHPYEDYRRSYAARSELGGGALATQSHEFDYCLWFFGMPSRVFALGGHLSRLEIDVEDTATVLLVCEMEGRSFPVHLQLDYLQQPPVRGCQIIGDEGKIYWDYFSAQARFVDRKTGNTDIYQCPELQRNQLFLDELKHFLACIRGEAKPIVSLREGVKSLKVVLAAKKSLKTGNVMELR